MMNTKTYRIVNQYERGLRSWLPVRVIVEETEHAVLISDGAIVGPLETGVSRLRPRRDRIVRLPATEQLVLVPGQDILSQDGAGIRITVSAVVRVSDPVGIVRRGGTWRDAFYLLVQLTLRNLVAELTLEDLLARRNRLDVGLREQLPTETEALGLELIGVAVRDLGVPGELKRAVGEVVAARLSGQAALERARGETAALRSLANAAKAAADNPALLQLRMIQQMEQSTGNTYVVGPTAGLATPQALPST